MTTVINSPSDVIATVIEQQRQFFAGGKTKDFNFRRQQLEKLKAAIKQNESQIISALHQDLHKPELERIY